MNTTPHPSFDPVQTMLEREQAPPLLIRQFAYAFHQLYEGTDKYLSKQHIGPVDPLPELATLSAHEAAGRSAMDQTVMIKLNGGLGTSMGLNRAKSLLDVKPGLTFLDIIARQVLHLRRAQGIRIPLLFMNSFSTRSDTLDALARYGELATGQNDVPLDFLQHRVPKLLAETGGPARHPTRPELNWCPPGHGDLYVCLQTTGLCERLLAEGYRYAFVSNADNLGAVVDTRILGYLAEQHLPFLMEATRRTAADRKGGHLARHHDGRLLLRETAQCPPDETDDFQDVERYPYFNTNSLWLDLQAVWNELEKQDGLLPLPVMVNQKTLDPREADSPPVYQLETAMGSALSVIPGATAIEVPRARFAPVKTTDDLLALRSDRFTIDEAFHVVPAANGAHAPIHIDLDKDFFRRIDDFDKRFPHGAPSLIDCTRLHVRGDVTFGRNVVCRGPVRIDAHEDGTHYVPDDSLLT